MLKQLCAVTHNADDGLPMRPQELKYLLLQEQKRREDEEVASLNNGTAVMTNVTDTVLYLLLF